MALKNEAPLNSLIGEGSVFDGRFYINGSLQVDGRFEGEIKTKEQLIVGRTGKVKTDIVAKKVVVGGTVIGNIDAEEEVYLLSTGRVLGNIRAPKINIEEGVVIEGEITITGGQKKDVRKVIEESFNEGPKIEDLLSGNKIGEQEERGNSGNAGNKK